ncbi:MAG TPA: hypothetical protein VJ836_07795 [Candidatus Saccharimonadales bacterium]|nr:hypothetical protein [Candidatus Saccharimonadales bacterium]
MAMGHSLGGSIAILAGESNSHVVAYVALMSLVSGPRIKEDPEWKADGKVTFYRDVPPGDHHTTEQKQYDLPYSFFEDALKHDTQNASNYPPEEYALIAEPKQLIEIDSPHGYRYHQVIIHAVNAHIETFVMSLPPIDSRTAR